jgi:hypothetical protein
VTKERWRLAREERESGMKKREFDFKPGDIIVSCVEYDDDNTLYIVDEVALHYSVGPQEYPEDPEFFEKRLKVHPFTHHGPQSEVSPSCHIKVDKKGLIKYSSTLANKIDTISSKRTIVETAIEYLKERVKNEKSK